MLVYCGQVHVVSDGGLRTCVCWMREIVCAVSVGNRSLDARLRYEIALHVVRAIIGQCSSV